MRKETIGVILGLYWGYISIMENNVETTIELRFRVVMGVELVCCSCTRTTEFLLL